MCRIVGTACCFVLFGLGGLCLSVLVFAPLRVLVHHAPRRRRVAKRIVHRAFQCLVAVMRAFGLFTIEWHGTHKLQRQGLLVVANHPTLIDVVLLMSVMPRADCLVKSSLARNPFTRGPILAAGFLFNDSAEGLIEESIASLREGNNLIIFPEGSRTPMSGELRLRRGAAAISVRGGVGITPVRLSCSPPTLRKGDPWYVVPATRPHFVVDVGDEFPIDVPSNAHADPARTPRTPHTPHTRHKPHEPRHPAATRRLNLDLTAYFSKGATMQRPVTPTHAGGGT